MSSSSEASVASSASLLLSAASSAVSTILSSTAPTTQPTQRMQSELPKGSAARVQGFRGISFESFLSALIVAIVVFTAQIAIFLLLRNRLPRVFKPKTYLVPERERTDAPPTNPLGMLRTLVQFKDRDIIEKCGLDAYFFLRYLKTLLVIFIPIAVVVIPILIPLNYINGRGLDPIDTGEIVTGLDTLAWGNIKAKNAERYWAHLILALVVTVWVCTVFFLELRVYIKIRQDYLTSAEHRLRASATTVLVNSIPSKWLSEEALRGLFDVFPGGVRNVWLNRDLSVLLTKIHERDRVHDKLEKAETQLIKAAKIGQLEERKRERSRGHEKEPSKVEHERRERDQDQRAESVAAAGRGLSSGQRDDLPQDISDVLNKDYNLAHGNARPRPGRRGYLGGGVANFGQGILGSVGKARKGLKNLGQGVDEALETTNGFVSMEPAGPSSRPFTRLSEGSFQPTSNMGPAKQDGNTFRKATNKDMYLKDEIGFWQFWKPPAGGNASPIPQGSEQGDRSAVPRRKSTWQRLMALPFMHTDVEAQHVRYRDYWNKTREAARDRPPGAWERWVQRKDRPTHRLAHFSWTGFLPSIPLINKKVDTIDWCRKELARLNMEVEEDQNHPERYPLMGSAFIQFNNQISAHMACQSLIHHIPKQMAPREVEISPKDVIWDNMSITWWQYWARSAIVTTIVIVMLILWTVPIAFTASLGQLDSLVQRFQWLEILNTNHIVKRVAQVVAGVLPAVLLSLILPLIPVILGVLAEFKGVKTRSKKNEFVQLYFFPFLFFQVFVIISFTSLFVASINTLFANVAQLSNINAILILLADNLPKAANYFFSYMILQALSASSATLLQIGALLTWNILARVMDSTARSKWSRNTNLSDVKWGSFFPVYTNFACITLVYVVVAPIISIFAIITFSLLWVSQRYSMLYVKRFNRDTGGVLYPRAINQTFTGLYIMDLTLASLFFLVRDGEGNNACTVQGIIISVALVLTILYQVLLNRSFSPLFRYLPITVEDEACIRDEGFNRAQAYSPGLYGDGPFDGDIELKKGMSKTGTWAPRDGSRLHSAAEYKRVLRQKDIKFQRVIGEALFGGYHDEIEDLNPDERNALVRYAFQHEALRARRPTVWIPRDDVGVSDDEIRCTRELTEFVWISNVGTALDSKVRVVYGRAPPDFSELDLINL